jgi:hypothetical protein
MKTALIAATLSATLATAAGAQGLRQVPQHFIYVEPLGLVFGIGTVGLEKAIARTTTLELRGVGVYAKQDGVQISGGGAGLGLRQYFGGGEAQGFVFGIFGDGLYLTGDYYGGRAPGYLQAGFETRATSFYFGLGGLTGYRLLSSRTGFFMEPQVAYQYLFGPRPLIPGSQYLQSRLGFTFGLALGAAF